ncbi:MCE family protein [Nocardia sp. NEAU-G5]|uniref:MCE family protein n=1 Tax=Nocardia albiluteola TaxID=2842303 RepID=A0ABS6AUH1_9NOCA|nr:MCE family protein [Nocardia albiluteola]
MPTEQFPVQPSGADATDAKASGAKASEATASKESAAAGANEAPTQQIPVQKPDTAAAAKATEPAAADGDSAAEAPTQQFAAQSPKSGKPEAAAPQGDPSTEQIPALATTGAAAGGWPISSVTDDGPGAAAAAAHRDPLTALRGSGRGVKVLIALGTVAAIVLAGVLWWVFDSFNTTRITAYFDKSIGIYQGSDVRILGVPVGKVDSITPMGDQVKVVMSVDRKYDIPADASAAQITPSVVSDRYIQLTPVYKGGPKMGRDATIPKERTATPVEVDRLYKSIAELSDALGPNGANKDGAVNQLVKVSAANLAGNGDALANSLTQLSRAASYLSDARGDIFGTIKNLQVFVHTLAVNDAQVRQFNSQLADLAGFLAGERSDLGQALNLLSLALGDVARFVDNNRDLVASNAQALTKLTQTLSDQRNDVANILPVLPLALSNLINVHNGESGTLDMRANFTDLQNPFGTICKLIDLGKLRPGDPKFEAIGRQMAPILNQCKTLSDQLKAGVETPSLVLPFGILSGENEQRAPVPGTVPGTPSNQQPPSQKPGGTR